MFVLRSNKSGFTLHVVLVLLASAAGVVLIGLFTKNQIEIQNQEKQFLSAQKELGALGEKLAKITNADKQEAIAYCDYGHVKFGKGGRTCWVKYQLSYDGVDQKKATEIFDKATTILPKASLVMDSNSLYKNTKAIKFYSDSLKKYCLAELDMKNQITKINISCSGEAKAEYFPVKE